MSLVFADGFEHEGVHRRISYSGMGHQWRNGRYGGRLIRVVDTVGPSYSIHWRYSFVDAFEHVFVRFYFYPLNWRTDQPWAFYLLKENYSALLALQTPASGNNWRIYFNNAYQGTTLISYGAWNVIEFAFRPHATDGYYALRVNGTLRYELTGQNTSAYKIAAWQVSGYTNIADAYFDDFVIHSAAGQHNNSWPGAGYVTYVSPTQNGDLSQFTGSDGNSVDNYLLVDESVQNASDYVESSTVGQVDLHGYGNITLSSGHYIHGVQQEFFTKGAGSEFKGVTRINGQDYKTDVMASNTGRHRVGVPFDVNPVTGSYWRPNEISQIQTGIENAGTSTLQLTRSLLLLHVGFSDPSGPYLSRGHTYGLPAKIGTG